MCGICGIFNYTQKPIDQEMVRRMNNLLTYRGPDAEGYYFSDHIGMGSRRLSIIDLSGGDMPVYNEDGRISIVFNGEIYGYIELRDTLEKLGHRFKTRSDTETIVHAYEEYGEDFVSQLNGMFAFALWDSNQEELFIARDRVGEKPLFYTEVNGRFLFASEIKSLLLDPEVQPEVNPDAINQYLTALYIPYPQTIFKDIYKLPPGHFMRISRSGIKVKRYWHPEKIRPRDLPMEQATEELRELLADAVRIQMRSDVPVGAFLSAGMDSTSVVAFAKRTTKGANLKTFAVGFEGADWDERPGARSVAEMYETDHYDISVAPEDLWRLLPKLVWHMDEPMGDGSIVPLYIISSLARQHVKVVLCGAGGDELFAGYPRYEIGFRGLQQRTLQSLPTPIKEAAEGLGNLYSAGFGNRVRVAMRSVDRQYFEDHTWLTPAERQGLLQTNRSSYAQVVSKHYHRLAWSDPVNRLMFVDINTYMSDDLLPMTDRMTMGVSLEGRLPFLDYRLIEWALALPGDMKLRNGTNKYVLRKAMNGLLPEEILDRPKRGFGPPFNAWLRAGILDYARELLLSPRAVQRRIYDPDFIAHLLDSDLDEHRTSQQIWMLLILEIWFRIFVDNPDPQSVPADLRDLL